MTLDVGCIAGQNNVYQSQTKQKVSSPNTYLPYLMGEEINLLTDRRRKKDKKWWKIPKF